MPDSLENYTIVEGINPGEFCVITEQYIDVFPGNQRLLIGVDPLGVMWGKEDGAPEGNKNE